MLSKNNPFDPTVKTLVSIWTGIIAADADNINCDLAKEVGVAIHLSMDNTTFTDVKLRKADQVRTFSVINDKNSISRKDKPADMSNLFHRFLIQAERTQDIASYFSYELTAELIALFKNGYMRKPKKPQLARCLDARLTSESVDIAAGATFVIDGGSLRHEVRWLRNTSFRSIPVTSEVIMANQLL